ncbi:crotonobetainyl-CoA:carnitine CoA-transferase CaiB-like acyl-CoA transferase [Propionibacteriaceae bacterium ES.041]|uniref:CaiB/BaiF CoA transferase family protein n=1 Tax=Enemella evansiae TaxID=2016499 RepID=UPI000B972BF7|nr:CoA transferase [Enemella evansiae]OYN98628.1 carnitine dehydratase [Enemella evansiae]PFG65669.1 crotonobetainyl-CoA:carnitine CoA-transferase CaiB-like acyl-CoA transferase [Propionibacteriaceae bacterium ES.041]
MSTASEHGQQSPALTGIRVVDLSRVLAGPLCAQLLADHGAEVIKVEPPRGDETRAWGPPFVGPDTSAYFTGVNRNKANLCLDLARPSGQRVLADLLDRADVVIENFKAGTLARWGFTDERIRSRWPGLIHCRITGFGVDGPMGGLPGYDAVAQAFSGLMSVNGEPDGEPLRVGVPIADMVTGIYACTGILLALQARQRTGTGQLVDCNLVNTAVSLLHPHSAAYLMAGQVGRRTGSAHPTIAPYNSFPAADGPIFIGAGNDSQFRRLVAVLGIPELGDDRRFLGNGDRVAHRDALEGELRPRIATWQREPLAKELLALGIPATPIHDVGEALDDAHVRGQEMVVELDGYRGTGIPIKLRDTPGRVVSAPRSRGADSEAVLRDLGYDESGIAALFDDGTVD